MSTKAPGRLIDLQHERLRRGLPRYHREPLQTWRRKVKLAVAGACLLGLLASLLSLVLEPAAPGKAGEGLFEGRSSGGGGREVEDGPAWFTATGGRR